MNSKSEKAYPENQGQSNDLKETPQGFDQDDSHGRIGNQNQEFSNRDKTNDRKGVSFAEICEQQDGDRLSEEAISETQVHVVLSKPPTDCGHASHDEEHVGREDPRVWRDPTSTLEEESVRGKVERTQGRAWTTSQHGAEGHDDGTQPSRQEEVGPPALCRDSPAEEDHRTGDHPEVACFGKSSNPGEDRSNFSGPHGFREALGQDLHRSTELGCAVRGMVHDNLQGRASKLEDGTIPEVGEDDGGAGPQGEERCQGDDSLTKEDADPTKGRQWQGLYQRSVFSRPLRRILPHGSHSTIIGRGVDCRAGSGETGDADPRVEASAGPSTQESSDEGGPRGEEPASDVLSRHGSEIDEKDGMAFTEQNSRPLGSTKENKILQQFQQSFEEDWDFLVSSNRCLLLEVCCSPDSILTETCLKRFGPGSAVRVAHWNGGDVETEAGRNHVKRLIRELRPRLVWFAPECGPYSPMQHLNCRSEKQRKELEEKRKHARAQYDGVCELARYTHGFGLPPLLELSERCEGWNFPVFQTLKHDLGCFVGVCKGCQVGLRNELGELLGRVGNS